MFQIVKQISFIIFLFFLSCSSSSNSTIVEEVEEINNNLAKIVSVTTSGNENSYTFSVGIESLDTGCNQYANWWEVITEDGNLIYRRILGHSHVNEQPFIRSGGSVTITNNQIVIVRMHMNNTGYSIKIYKGSVANGFSAFEVEENFATNLATQDPLPTGCAF